MPYWTLPYAVCASSDRRARTRLLASCTPHDPRPAPVAFRLHTRFRLSELGVSYSLVVRGRRLGPCVEYAARPPVSENATWSATKACLNTGLGLEAARQLLSQGVSVLVTARDEAKAAHALRALK